MKGRSVFQPGSSSAYGSKYNGGSVPNITGGLWTNNAAIARYENGLNETGAIYVSNVSAGTGNINVTGSYTLGRGFTFNASRVSSCYGRANEDVVIPQSLFLGHVIKY